MPDTDKKEKKHKKHKKHKKDKKRRRQSSSDSESDDKEARYSMITGDNTPIHTPATVLHDTGRKIKMDRSRSRKDDDEAVQREAFLQRINGEAPEAHLHVTRVWWQFKKRKSEVRVDPEKVKAIMLEKARYARFQLEHGLLIKKERRAPKQRGWNPPR